MSLTLYWKPTKDTRHYITNDVFLGNSISVSHKIMDTPSISFQLPTEVLMDSPIPDAQFEFVLTFDNGHIFHGITERIDSDHVTGVTTIQAVHVATELQHRRVPTNYAIKELTLGEIYTYDEYIRPASMGEGGEIISNQKPREEDKKDGTEPEEKKVTKTGNKTINTVYNEDGSKTKTTTYEMSDGTTREVVSHITKVVTGKGAYVQTTVTTRPDGTVTTTVTTKDGYNKGKTEVTTEKPKEDKDVDKGDNTTKDDGISVNYVELSKLSGMFNDENWTYKFTEEGTDDIVITYLFSNQDKLQALTDVCKQTEDVFWRVSLTEERTIEIGKFGQYKELMVNETNLLGNDLVTQRDFTTITNYGIYLTDKSDSGTTTLTLRDVYNRPYLQNPNFPVILTGEEVNTERSYDYIDLIPFGANNNGDYAVLDKEGLALEAGRVYEQSFTSNDVQPVANNNKELSDEDRLVASRQLYTQAVRKLIHSRRKVGYTFDIKDLPNNYNVGDKVRLTFVDRLLKSEKCSKYFKKVMTMDDYFYISEILVTTTYDGFTSFKLTVEKYLYNDKEV